MASRYDKEIFLEGNKFVIYAFWAEIFLQTFQNISFLDGKIFAFDAPAPLGKCPSLVRVRFLFDNEIIKVYLKTEE